MLNATADRREISEIAVNGQLLLSKSSTDLDWFMSYYIFITLYYSRDSRRNKHPPTSGVLPSMPQFEHMSSRNITY
jgi:hypothetical protein